MKRWGVVWRPRLQEEGQGGVLFTSSLQGGDGGACKLLGWLLGAEGIGIQNSGNLTIVRADWFKGKLILSESSKAIFGISQQADDFEDNLFELKIDVDKDLSNLAMCDLQTYGAQCAYFLSLKGVTL
ncbi:hypothetical protein Tco_0459147 [Tanacetum coccineum]